MFRWIFILFFTTPLFGSNGFDYLEKAKFKRGGKVSVSCIKSTIRWNQIVDIKDFQRGDFCVKSKWISSGFFKSENTKNCFLNADVLYSKSLVKEISISEVEGCSKIKSMIGTYQCFDGKCQKAYTKKIEIFSNKILLKSSSLNESFVFETTGKVVLLGSSKVQMAYIPSGEFTVGSLSTEQGRLSSEGLRPVRISKPFLLQRYELTQQEWRELNKNEKPGYLKCDEVKNGGKACSNYPISFVKLKTIQDFINRLNKLKNPKVNCGNVHSSIGYAKASKTSGCFRLPTEAEWEYAARAGTKTPFGLPVLVNEQNAKKFMNIDSRFLKPVGFYPYSNLWGLFDMHGNVQEFTQDHYKGRYDALRSRQPENDPLYFSVSQKEAKSVSFWKSHVVKGGDFTDGIKRARSASRGSYYSDSRRIRTGFRLARTL